MKTESLLVSIIVPTKNSETTIEKCLKAIKDQTYPNIEVIIVDNYSTDATVGIVRKLGYEPFRKGPERSVQRNFGAAKSNGEYILFLDSDMTAPKNLVRCCINMLDSENADAVLIPYVSIGDGYWARSRCLESLFYQSKEFAMPRFFRREPFMSVGGFDTALNASEDIELYLRLVNLGFKVVFSDLRLVHLEKKVSLTNLLKKDVWAVPYVSKYLKRRNSYNIKFSGIKFPLTFIRKSRLLKSHTKYLPGLLLLKSIDYFTVLLSWLLK